MKLLSMDELRSVIRDYGFEVLRSMMRGTINDLDKVISKLRSIIPRSLEIAETPTGCNLQERKAEHAM